MRIASLRPPSSRALGRVRPFLRALRKAPQIDRADTALKTMAGVLSIDKRSLVLLKRDVLARHCELFANLLLVRGLAKSGPIVVAYDPHSKGCERE